MLARTPDPEFGPPDPRTHKVEGEATLISRPLTSTLAWFGSTHTHTNAHTINREINVKKKNTGTKDLKCLRPYIVNLNRMNLTQRKLTPSGFTLSGNSLNSEPTSHHSHQSLCLFPEAGKLSQTSLQSDGLNEENTGD